MIKSTVQTPDDFYDRDAYSESVVTVRNLSRKFGKKQALDNISIDVPRGVVMGLVGLNGAGKTTLLKHLLGLLRAQSGTVTVFGKDPSRNPQAVLHQVGYLTEEDTLPGWMKVWQILKFTKPFFPTRDDDYAQELLNTFGIKANAVIKKMSKGQRARVGLTLALAHRPELLILDEPSSGLDPVVRNDILGAIIRTIADEGNTVLFSSHLLDEVQRVSDMIGVIRNGQLVECGPLEDLQTRYQRVTVRAPNAMNPPSMQALGMWQRNGDEWSAILNVNENTLQASVQAMGGSVVSSKGVSLNEWFLDMSRASK